MVFDWIMEKRGVAERIFVEKVAFIEVKSGTRERGR